MKMFTFIDAKKFFSTKEVFQIKTSVKDLSVAETFTFLSDKCFETGNVAYAQLAATMIVKTYIN